ncbi:MAG: type II toxin-antitoxin system PemK/MazF family toxin [Myxococcales bacterium]|nr:type II toxin-antitoxin system PemK/MazF family toxin [Myxococcales bacterium]
MIAVREGEVFWLVAPEASVSHPHVVVEVRATEIVACALTSNLHRAKELGNVLLEPGEGDLPKQSVVVVSQPVAVSAAHLGGRIGSLSPARLSEIRAGQRFQRSLLDR